jgi:hypothetical protein
MWYRQLGESASSANGLLLAAKHLILEPSKLNNCLLQSRLAMSLKNTERRQEGWTFRLHWAQRTPLQLVGCPHFENYANSSKLVAYDRPIHKLKNKETQIH